MAALASCVEATLRAQQALAVWSEFPPQRLRERVGQPPSDGHRLLAVPVDEVNVAAVDERGGAAAGDLAGLADEQVYWDALGFVAADETAVGVVAAGAVPALPLEEGRGC